MKYLFSAWSEMSERVQSAKHILLLSDYDGTLTPIKEKPELALMSDYARRILHSLSAKQHITVGIISGRALSDLKEKVNVSGLIYAGNHGFEIEGPGFNFINPITDEIRPFFRVMRQILSMSLGTIKGVLVEDKGITLSIHYRQAEADKAGEIKEIIDRATNTPTALGMVRVTTGKKVYEVRPAVNWDKGKAVRFLMKRYGKGGRQSGLLPIYLGDDLTDESGFEMINKYGDGISIFVGEDNSTSAAHYFLKSHLEVYFLMDKLLQYAERGLLCEQLLTT